MFLSQQYFLKDFCIFQCFGRGYELNSGNRFWCQAQMVRVPRGRRCENRGMEAGGGAERGTGGGGRVERWGAARSEGYRGRCAPPRAGGSPQTSGPDTRRCCPGCTVRNPPTPFFATPRAAPHFIALSSDLQGGRRPGGSVFSPR